MEIKKTQADDKTLFVLDGRLDTTSAPKLQEVLIPEFDVISHVELDFTKIAYVSSAGLRVLLMGVKTAQAKGGQQTVIGVTPDVMEVFEMTGFSDILTIK